MGFAYQADYSLECTVASFGAMPRKLRRFYANTFAYMNIYLYLARRSHRNSDVGTPLAALQILLAQRFRLIIRGRLEESQLLWRLGLFVRKGTFRSVRRAHRVLGAKNSLTDADARQLEEAFRAKLAKLESSAVTGEAQPAVGTPSRHLSQRVAGDRENRREQPPALTRAVWPAPNHAASATRTTSSSWPNSHV